MESESPSVNNELLITEIKKFRHITLEEKERILDLFAEIMGYQETSESQLNEDDLPNLTPNDTSTTDDVQVSQDAKKVFQVSGNGQNIKIRGYKATLPRGSTVIRYKFNVNGTDQPVQGPQSVSQKFGHTKEKVIQKLQAIFGNKSEKVIHDFVQYDASFYQG